MAQAVRLTVALTAIQRERVRTLADRLGITMGEALRRLIDEALEVRENARQPRRERS
jgi:hypothetical protein